MTWIEKTGYTTPSRFPFKTWRWVPDRMPRIPQNILNCSVYLYANERSASAGRQSGGCGFLLSMPSNSREPVSPMVESLGRHRRQPSDQAFQFVVTAGHVASKNPVIRLNRKWKNGIEALRIDDWHFHNTSDLALAPVDLYPDNYELMMVPITILLDGVVDPLQESAPVGLGDDVFLISRFIGHDGKQTNWPAVRFGNISVLPREDERIALGREIDPQVAYLVETRTTPGASGSPVFVHVPGWELRDSPLDSERRHQFELQNFKTAKAVSDRNEKLRKDLGAEPIPYAAVMPPISPLVILLGVAGGYMFGPDEQVVYTKGQDPRQSDVRIARNAGMAWCMPSWKIVELLNYPELQELRDKQRREWDETPPAGALG